MIYLKYIAHTMNTLLKYGYKKYTIKIQIQTLDWNKCISIL